MQSKLLVSAVCFVFVAVFLLYLSYGVAVFRRELIDFKATPDDASAASIAAFQKISAVAEPVYWVLEDGSRQRAFMLPTNNGSSVIYAHGSPGSASGFAEMVSAMAAMGYGALVLDLPGYGESEGSRTWGPAYTESLIKGIDFLQQHDPQLESIGAFGYSMGGVVVARAASKDRRIRDLILMASYTNLTEQLHYSFKRRVPAMGYWAIAAAYWSGVEVSEMDLERSIRLEGQRLLVIGGDSDRVTPPYMQERIAAQVEGAELWLVEGGTHINLPTITGDEFYDRLGDFLRESEGTRILH
ncbi:MAG: alpha/beta fold hydrolase [Pseudomonadales bacterium]